ncbi:hypothetical protein LCGC14_1530600 [marine sediment metagenome]|uniref:Uncharacterized protein n=1 Tax=marine sediment metagenome TaxID=412755 RepID=A0A0F9LWW2_9ZZZZ
MTLTKSEPLLRQIKAANDGWFTRDNKRFFNDVSYRAYYGKITGKAYLARSTYAWTDMFGNKPRLHWRINNINQDTLEIEPLIDQELRDIFEAKAWLRAN